MQTTNFKVELENISAVKKKLNIEVAVEEVSRELFDVYKRLKATANVPGFRKGAVPLNVIKAKFSDQIKKDVVTHLVEISYSYAINENKLKPVSRPEVELKSQDISETEPFGYIATIEVQPYVDVDGYKGLELEKKEVTVEESEVEQTLLRLREGKAIYKDAQRPAVKGDILTIDFEAFIDNAPVKNSAIKNYNVVVGENAVLPGFSEALVGLSKGAKHDANLKFPEDYTDKDLSGKDVTFKVEVHNIKERILPEIGEEILKELRCESVEALKERIRNEVRGAKEKQEKERLRNDVLDRLIAKHAFEVPDALVAKYLSLILNRVVDNMKLGYVAEDDKGLNPEQFKEKYLKVAMRQVREDIILDSIALKEAVELPEEDVMRVIRNLAASRNEPFDAIRNRIQQDGTLDMLRDGMKHEKVFDIIMASAALKA